MERDPVRTPLDTGVRAINSMLTVGRGQRIIAEKEELFDNKEHAILAHERATGVKKLVTIKGIKHYGIYNEARDQAQKEALAWFDEHLNR